MLLQSTSGSHPTPGSPITPNYQQRHSYQLYIGEQQGDKIRVRHILMRPEITQKDNEAAFIIGRWTDSGHFDSRIGH